jgi:hypothetical protein
MTRDGHDAARAADLSRAGGRVRYVGADGLALATDLEGTKRPNAR